MNKQFIKTYIKPLFQVLGLYKQIYVFYFALLGFIRNISNHFFKTFYKTAPILLYHRIAVSTDDPLMLCVSPSGFEKHLQFLTKKYNVISLSELSRRTTSGSLEGNEAAVTFDDGYQDNLNNALPLLEKYNVPATIFISTKSFGGKASFEGVAEFNEHDNVLFLSEDEIKVLSNNPLIEIGAHTVTHPRLSSLNLNDQKQEIIESKMVLEKITGKEITMFAYPFGGAYDFNSTSEQVVKDVGFEFAYTSTGFLTRNTKKHFRISRLNVRECEISTLSRVLLT